MGDVSMARRDCFGYEMKLKRLLKSEKQLWRASREHDERPPLKLGRKESTRERERVSSTFQVSSTIIK